MNDGAMNDLAPTSTINPLTDNGPGNAETDPCSVASSEVRKSVPEMWNIYSAILNFVQKKLFNNQLHTSFNYDYVKSAIEVGSAKDEAFRRLK